MRVLCINIKNITAGDYNKLKQLISEERIQRASRFHFKDDSYRCIIAGVLLRYCLPDTFESDIAIDYNPFGKPRISNLEDFHFNISHSGSWVVIAYGHSNVGVDIERINAEKLSILDWVLSNDERKYIYSASADQRFSRFIRIWSAKESYIKYLGTGLSTPMNSFSVSISKRTVHDTNRIYNPSLCLNSLQYTKDYFISICTEEKVTDIREVFIHDIYSKFCLTDCIS